MMDKNCIDQNIEAQSKGVHAKLQIIILLLELKWTGLKKYCIEIKYT